MVQKQEAGRQGISSYPFRHVKGSFETRDLRIATEQSCLETGLEVLHDLKPQLGQEHLLRAKPVVDRPRWCTQLLGDCPDRDPRWAVQSSETARRIEDLVRCELSWPSHHF
jgi:hypothetical protein